MSASNLTAQAPNQITFLADTKTHRFRFDIPSSDGSTSYRVSQATTTDQWQCGCPSWIYQKGPMIDRKPCKHLRAMSDLLLQIEGKAPAAAQVQAAPKQIGTGKAAAQAALNGLVADAEREVAAAKTRLADAEAKLEALKAAAKAA